jgi:hypothetical protein
MEIVEDSYIHVVEIVYKGPEKKEKVRENIPKDMFRIFFLFCVPCTEFLKL